jgi:hypothetical protein
MSRSACQGNTHWALEVCALCGRSSTHPRRGLGLLGWHEAFWTPPPPLPPPLPRLNGRELNSKRQQNWGAAVDRSLRLQCHK